MSNGGVDGTRNLTGPISLEVDLVSLTKAVGSGIAWVVNRAMGRRILVLGPKAAGKTSLVDYVLSGSLDIEVPATRYNRTLRVEETPAFRLRIGQRGVINLRVKRVVDTPGHLVPIAQAELVGSRAPHGVAMVLDASKKPRRTGEWVSELCVHLDQTLRERRRVARKLRTLFVLLNKRDKLDENRYNEVDEAVRSALTHGLSAVLGHRRVRAIRLAPTILVQNPDGARLSDSALRALAKSLR